MLIKPADRGRGDCGPAPQSLVCKFGVRLSHASKAACNCGEERQKELRSQVPPALSLRVLEPPAKPAQAPRPCLGCAGQAAALQAPWRSHARRLCLSNSRASGFHKRLAQGCCLWQLGLPWIRGEICPHQLLRTSFAASRKENKSTSLLNHFIFHQLS